MATNRRDPEGPDGDGLDTDELNVDPIPSSVVFPESPAWLVIASIQALWNGAVVNGYALHENEPPTLEEFFLKTDEYSLREATRFLAAGRRAGVFQKKTINGKTVGWAPTPRGYDWLCDKLENVYYGIHGAVNEHTSSTEADLFGDPRESLPHRAMTWQAYRLREAFPDATTNVNPGTQGTNIRPDLQIQPSAWRHLDVEVWAHNNNQKHQVQKWKGLQERDNPVIHVFESTQLLKRVLSELYNRNMIGLPTDPGDWDSRYPRDRALDHLEAEWELHGLDGAVGDIITQGALYDDPPKAHLEHYRDTMARIGLNPK